MSLSEELRDELASIAPVRRCCRLAELSALFHSAGTWHLHGHGELSVQLDLASGHAARRAFALLRDLGVHSEIRTYSPALVRPGHALPAERRGRRRHRRDAPGSGRPIAPRRRRSRRPPKRVVGRSCCRGAYLRGALLGAGSLSGPRSPHLELRAADLDGAQALVDAAAREGVKLHALERRTHAAAYTKSGETIADLLALAGASETALRLDEHAVVAATRSDANRLANADEANVKRTVHAAQRQLDAIRRLDLETLPAKLQEVAALRLRHPALSLGELAARCDPPITKSAAHHRFAELERLAGAEEGELRGRTPPLSSHAL